MAVLDFLIRIYGEIVLWAVERPVPTTVVAVCIAAVVIFATIRLFARHRAEAGVLAAVSGACLLVSTLVFLAGVSVGRFSVDATVFDGCYEGANDLVEIVGLFIGFVISAIGTAGGIAAAVLFTVSLFVGSSRGDAGAAE